MVERECERALIVGLGMTGLSCARHLLRRGYRVTVADSRREPPMLAELKALGEEVACVTGAFDAALFEDPGLLVVSPGVSLREPVIARAIARGARAVGDIELFAQCVTAPVIAVTGANGKSTVTALTGEMCREAGLQTRVGGNIGVPVLALLEGEVPDVYVLELSSFQLETTHSLNAHAATVLNLSPDHLDRYASLEEYARAKARIFRGQGVMVLNADDARVATMAQPNRRQRWFSLNASSGAADFGLTERAGKQWLGRRGEPWWPVDRVRLQGRHNLANVLAAMALADTLAVPRDAMERAVAGFTGLPHRCQLVAEHEGISWINDSKATNVGALLAALAGQSRPVVLIAGGDAKGADFGALREVAARVRTVVLIGRDAGRIEAVLAGLVPIVHAADMAQAVARAAAAARRGDVVLLAPGCASFDMFRDYVHRGEAFTAAVQALTRDGGRS